MIATYLLFPYLNPSLASEPCLACFSYVAGDHVGFLTEEQRAELTLSPGTPQSAGIPRPGL